MRIFLKSLLVTMCVAVIGAAWLGLSEFQKHMACRKQGEELTATIDRIQRDVKIQLRPGTERSEVVKFLETNGFQVAFETIGSRRITGTKQATGCSPFGCGSNEALIGVRVVTDENWRVVETPKVIGMYTDCM